MGGTGISREALLQQLIAAATQNPAAQGSTGQECIRFFV